MVGGVGDTEEDSAPVTTPQSGRGDIFDSMD
jgi:hypothetical protein